MAAPAACGATEEDEAAVIADPRAAGVVACVEDAGADSAVVERARACAPAG